MVKKAGCFVDVVVVVSDRLYTGMIGSYRGQMLRLRPPTPDSPIPIRHEIDGGTETEMLPKASSRKLSPAVCHYAGRFQVIPSHRTGRHGEGSESAPKFSSLPVSFSAIFSQSIHCSNWTSPALLATILDYVFDFCPRSEVNCQHLS
jgi:hypothetical protein